MAVDKFTGLRGALTSARRNEERQVEILKVLFTRAQEHGASAEILAHIADASTSIQITMSLLHKAVDGLEAADAS